MEENLIWSTHVQGTQTLYRSRRLRFDDRFAGLYLPLLGMSGERELRILEIGCGPGALSGALKRWYPKAKVTGLDRDDAFIRFANQREPGITFLAGDATALPFPDGSFDVCISYTVSEHIPPAPFYEEQMRVLAPGGVCLVLSARQGIHLQAKCLDLSPYEAAFWARMGQQDDTRTRFHVGQYPQSEAELPLSMAAHGFGQITTGFLALDFTPDNPGCTPGMAHDIINAARHTELDSISSLAHSPPGGCQPEELAEMTRLANARYDQRLALYERGEQQWDTSVSLVMVIRGVKPTQT